MLGQNEYLLKLKVTMVVNAMIFTAVLLACVVVLACVPRGSKPTPKPGLKAAELRRRERLRSDSLHEAMLQAERQLEREWLQQYD